MAPEKKKQEVLSDKVELRDREEKAKVADPAALLNQSLDALHKMGGFQLIKGLVKDIEKMDPKRKASKNAFLSEDDFAETRKRMRNELAVLLSILEGDGKDPLEIVEQLNAKREEIEGLMQNNLYNLHEELRNLEVCYRTLSSFFANAGQEKIDCITLMSVDKEELGRFDSDDTQRVQKELSKYYDRLNLRNNYSLFVLPGYLGDAVKVRSWADTAFHNKVMLVTDFRDCETFEDLKTLLEKASLQGSETKMGNVVMTCNYILGRKKSERADEEDNLYFPGSAAVAGRMSKVKEIVISQGVAGKRYGTLDNVMGARLDLLKSEIEALIKLGVVPMVEEEGRTMAFSNRTLYNGSTLGLQEYSVVRVFDWIGKVFQNYVNDEAFTNWNSDVKRYIQEHVHDFLSRHKGPGRLFENYELKGITQDKDKVIHISVEIKPFYAAKSFLIQLTGKKGEGLPEWNQNVE